MNPLARIFIPLALIVLTSFTFPAKEIELTGVWVRHGDHLRIKVEQEGRDRLFSFIIEEGSEKFPCAVSHLPIYKNIERKGKNLWTCDFLVVTMGSCATEYEAGIIRLTKEEHLEIICPGFDDKLYSRLKPRLE